MQIILNKIYDWYIEYFSINSLKNNNLKYVIAFFNAVSVISLMFFIYLSVKY